MVVNVEIVLKGELTPGFSLLKLFDYKSSFKSLFSSQPHSPLASSHPSHVMTILGGPCASWCLVA